MTLPSRLTYLPDTIAGRETNCPPCRPVQGLVGEVAVGALGGFGFHLFDGAILRLIHSHVSLKVSLASGRQDLRFGPQGGRTSSLNRPGGHHGLSSDLT